MAGIKNGFANLIKLKNYFYYCVLEVVSIIYPNREIHAEE